MKIEKIESVLAGDSHIVRIITDNGIEGIGQSACWGYMEATDAVISSFREYLIGKDPLQIDHHWQYLYRMGPFRGSILTAAISAIDIALWDIKGKFYEAPVWQLLGGKLRNKIKNIKFRHQYRRYVGSAADRDSVKGIYYHRRRPNLRY